MTLGQALKMRETKTTRYGEINWGAKILQAQKKDKQLLVERAKQSERQSQTRENFRNLYCKKS